MSYNTINECANDVAFIGRLTAAAAQEGTPDDPAWTASRIRYEVAAAADIEAAYASALAAGNPNPGGDETVVTDGMILAAVQAELAT